MGLRDIPPDDCPHNQGAIYTFGEVKNVITGEVVHSEDNGGWRCTMCGLLLKKVKQAEDGR